MRCKIFIDDVHTFTQDERHVEAIINWLHYIGITKIRCERVENDQ